MADKPDAAKLLRSPKYPDWLERIDLVRAVVHLTEKDSVTILALPFGEIGAALDKGMRLVLGAVDFDDVQIERMDQLADLLKGVDWLARFDELVALIDGPLTRSIGGADAGGIEQLYGVNFDDLASTEAATRDALWRALPIPVLRRIVTGIIIHSGNL